MVWICFAYWQSSFARKTVYLARDNEALAATRDRVHSTGIAAAAATGSVWQLYFGVAARGLQPAFLFCCGLHAPCSRRLAENNKGYVTLNSC